MHEKEIAVGGHTRQADKYVVEVGERVDTVALAGDDDGVNDVRALAGVAVADEQPVFLADGRGTDGVFDQIVVQTTAAMLEVRGERLPMAEQIGAGFAEQ